jgi:glycine cleavage system H protein
MNVTMSSILPDRKYTKDHEWASAKGQNVTVGITDFAQTSLGDVTFVQLPETGKVFKKGEIIGSVESVKAVSDIYAPISGKITKVNQDVLNDPALLNQDPYGKAWLIEVEASNAGELNELLSPEAYKQHAE